MPKPLIRFLALVAILALAGFGCQGASKEEQQAMRPVKLTWWRVFDDPDSVSSIIESYRKIHPNVSISYRKLRFEEYEDELINALAEDRGPDIFSIHNTALKKYQSKLLPLPSELKIAYQTIKGSIKKEVVTEIRKEKTLRLDQLRNQFVDQVSADVVLNYKPDNGEAGERIFGLPLALDTMVLYWNRDMLNTARIPEPAKNWEEFLEHVKLLTKFDSKGKILQAGAAIGTATNIERSTDLLSVIMMQNGTVMMDNNSVSFSKIPSGMSREAAPGLEALRFYTDFANPSKEAYTWNVDMPNSLEAFTSGQVAYFFGYAYHLPIIRARAPKLNFGLASIPQIDPEKEVNFANYWVEGVSSKTKNPDFAWDFIQFAAKEKNVKDFLEQTEKPTALRGLVASQSENLDLAVFAEAVLTAKSWYTGKDTAAVEAAFRDMIQGVVSGVTPAQDAIGLAASRVSQTLK